MNIHEYQGKELFRKYGVTTPRGIPAFSVDEAVIDHALSKDLEKRFQTGAELAEAIRTARRTGAYAPAHAGT